jgi:hypothetical protein
MSKFLSMGQAEAKKEDVSILLHDVNEEEADRLLPIPSYAEKLGSRTLLVNCDVPFDIYKKAQENWTDYKGFGRVYVDYSKSFARVLRYRDSKVIEHYSDIAFGYNLLVGMLLKHGFYSVHASCVQVKGKGILFTGNGGKGKSTAASSLRSTLGLIILLFSFLNKVFILQSPQLNVQTHPCPYQSTPCSNPLCLKGP